MSISLDPACWLLLLVTAILLGAWWILDHGGYDG